MPARTTPTAPAARSARRPTYALWDLETGNLVGAYDTEDAALAVVRRSIAQCGRGSVVALALARESPGRTRNIAQGEALADRALAAGPAPELDTPVAVLPPAHPGAAS
jgi:hypothetical protein